MKTVWLQRSGHPDCLLFFSGWGMDAEPFRFLAAKDCDVLLIHDYRRIPEEFDLSPFTGYARLHLAAWSMGVWVAAHILTAKSADFTSRLALAGTLRPIDEQEGIPPQSYAALYQNLNDETLNSFYSAMFDHQEHELRRFLRHRPRSGLSELHAELLAFQDLFRKSVFPEDIFTHKIVTSRDRIFSARNQTRHWGRKNCIVRNWAHFPFFYWNDWRDLLALAQEKNQGREARST